MTVIATRQFSLADQHRFADLTGDANPMHIDPVAARRTQFGGAVIHGVHGLMWALDQAVAAGADLRHVRGITARFNKPIMLNEVVEAHLSVVGSDIRLQLCIAGVECTSIRLHAEAPKLTAMEPIAGTPSSVRTTSRAFTLEQLQKLEGALDYSATGLSAAFPEAARILGIATLEGLAAATYIVGMEAPGLHSLFSRLTAAISSNSADRHVGFRVLLADPTYRVVDVEMQAPGLQAKLSTFARMAPVQSAAMEDIHRIVSPGEFAGQRALIIGGSRGLGAATAQIIAAGGGTVIITYASGMAEAEQLTADICSAGGQCAALPYDATRSPHDQLDLARLRPNAVYYFATGPIWRRKGVPFDQDVFSDFQRMYVEGFEKLARATHDKVDGQIVLFYPSSVYAAEPPADLQEYAAAKLAGEDVSRKLSGELRRMSILAERLPAVATDQNAAVVRVQTAKPHETMLPLIRHLQAQLLFDAHT